jgi:hypothetical protein
MYKGTCEQTTKPGSSELFEEKREKIHWLVRITTYIGLRSKNIHHRAQGRGSDEF